MNAEEARRISIQNNPLLKTISDVDSCIYAAAMKSEYYIWYHLEDVSHYDRNRLVEHYQESGYTVSSENDKLFIRW